MLNLLHRFRKNLRDTRGVSLLVTLGLTMVLVVIASSATKLVLGFMRTTKQVERANIAYSIAEGGVEMALYDLANYKDGYQTNSVETVCGGSVNVNQTTSFGASCSSSVPYRFVDFTGKNVTPNRNDLSGGRGFWRLFSRTLDSGGKYFIPNPYFVGDKDGNLGIGEWGEFTKSNSIGLSLLIDNQPSETLPNSRFLALSESTDKKIIFDPGAGWSPGENGNSKDEIFTWTFSALDGAGNEFSLQGVVWESDFNNSCDGGGGFGDCFVFDFNESATPSASDGSPFAGEDINKNIDESSAPGLCPGALDCVSALNRISVVSESFNLNTPKEFLEELNNSMRKSTNEQWVSARLTINLIATLAETSRDLSVGSSNALRFKLESDEVWADEYTYIISEGFSGDVKQTIETRFRRESVIPIFSYVIFQ